MLIKQSGWAWVRLQRQHIHIIESLRWVVAVVAVDLGAISLRRQSSLRDALESWIDIHLLFALLLIGFSFLCFSARRQRGPLSAPDICELSRWLSRMLYLLMYAVIGLRELFGMAGLAVSEQANLGSGPVGADLNNDLHALAASALVALVSIRVVLYRMWLHAAAPQPGR